MLEFVVLVKQSTLRAVSEHSTAVRFGGVRPLNEHEALVHIDQEVVQAIIRNAKPEDRRIDEVIMRLVL